MFTIIGGDGREYGPVTVEKIKEWVAGGRANGHTRARHVGDTDWKTLSEFPEFASLAGQQQAATTTGKLTPAQEPSQSGSTPQQSTPRYEEPEGPASVATGPVDEEAYAAEIIARGQRISVGEIIGESFTLLKENLWPIVGASVVSMIIQVAAQMIPFVGMVVSIFLGAVFTAGLYYYYLRTYRGQNPEFSEIFSGFTRAFLPLMLLAPVQGILLLAVALPLGGIGVTVYFTRMWMLLVLVPVFMVPFIYLSVAWMFAQLLIVDKKMGFWTALGVSRRVITPQWWPVFGLLILAALIYMAGLFALLIGAIFTFPIMIGSIVIAYEKIFNTRK